jgi:hypothetical protein
MNKTIKDIFEKGTEGAREELYRRKGRKLSSFITSDLKRVITNSLLLFSLSQQKRTDSFKDLAFSSGRLRYELYFARILGMRALKWLSLREKRRCAGLGRQTGSNKNTNPIGYVYNFHRHRIGDKLAVAALLRYVKQTNPANRIVLIDDNCYLGGKMRDLPSGLIFADIADSIWSIEKEDDYERVERQSRQEGLTRLAFTADFAPALLQKREGCCENSSGGYCYGNPWLMLPFLAKKGIYPEIHLGKISFPEEIEKRVRTLSNKKIVVLHILEDAQYNTERNHSFEQMEGLCRRIVTLFDDLFLIRVGQNTGHLLGIAKDKCLDATSFNLSILQSAMLLEMADLYIGGDTGMTHFAAALDVPHIIAIYGYKYNLGFTLRNCFNCVESTGIADIVSTFPSIAEGRLTKIIMKNNSFNCDTVLDAVINAF